MRTRKQILLLLVLGSSIISHSLLAQMSIKGEIAASGDLFHEKVSVAYKVIDNNGQTLQSGSCLINRSASSTNLQFRADRLIRQGQRVAISVSHEGYLTQILERPVISTVNFDKIKLERLCAIKGEVTTPKGVIIPLVKIIFYDSTDNKIHDTWTTRNGEYDSGRRFKPGQALTIRAVGDKCEPGIARLPEDNRGLQGDHDYTVNFELQPKTAITGHVLDSSKIEIPPLPGVKITCIYQGKIINSQPTDSSGNYYCEVPATVGQSIRIRAEKDRYISMEKVLFISEGDEKTVDFYLITPEHKGLNVKISVYNRRKRLVARAQIDWFDREPCSTPTDNNGSGYLKIYQKPEGGVDLEVSKDGYKVLKDKILLERTTLNHYEVQLRKDKRKLCNVLLGSGIGFGVASLILFPVSWGKFKAYEKPSNDNEKRENKYKSANTLLRCTAGAGALSLLSFGLCLNCHKNNTKKKGYIRPFATYGALENTQVNFGFLLTH